MGDDVLIVDAVEDLQHPQATTGGLSPVRSRAGFQNDADAMPGAAGPRAADPPAAVHLQVRMNAGRADPDEQVLAAADDLVDDEAGQVGGGVARHPDVAAREGATDQCLPQIRRGVPDGVTFGHVAVSPRSLSLPDLSIKRYMCGGGGVQA